MTQGKLVIIIGPTGSGKTELVKTLLARIPNSSRLITSTTRDPRPGEVDGKDFHFLTIEAFNQMITDGDVIEYAETHGFFYASSKSALETALNEHSVVFAVIDIKGALALKKHMPETLTVFINAGSLEVLKQRLLKSRKELKQDELEQRLKTAEFELGHMDWCDVVVDNPDGKFEETVEHMTKLLI